MTTDASETTFTVAVRTLCDFAARRGDLTNAFSPSPTALEGIAGHAAVARRRPATHQAEVSLTAAYRSLLVRGRADGYDPAANRLEEIKTFRGDITRMPANRRAVHRAQADVYAWMLCARDGLQSIDVSLIYYDVDRDHELAPLVEHRSAAELQATFESLCDAFIDWAEAERIHRAQRDVWSTSLRFPHTEFRAGQHAMAASVWRAVGEQRCLVAEAPTGIGKTVAALFPALKAASTRQVDRIFFLTARTTGRAMALRAARTIHDANPHGRCRVLELTAREKVCEHPELSCKGDSCPLAQGFYDRLPAARQEARDLAFLDRESIRTIALGHQVCPYYLAMEMARWCDLVVGDYNHWFDGTPLLATLAEEHDWKTVVLVDEAHNLPDRARAMFSQRLSSTRLRAATADAVDTVAKPLRRLARAWKRLASDMTSDYRREPEPPKAFLHALGAVTKVIGEAAADDPDGLPVAMRDFYFDALKLSRLAATFGTHSLFDLTRERIGRRVETTVGIRNLVPAPFLRPRHAATVATLFFSATLTPHAFYADLLGLPESTARVDIPSPFSSDQLTVRVVRNISTRLQHRVRSLASLITLIADAFERARGNYLVFLSSHAYLQQLAAAFAVAYPNVACWTQDRQMSEDQRDGFLGRFAPGGQGIGFAVLGGVFAEGVDLPGDRLVGAFVVTLGLPHFDDIHEAQREQLDAQCGMGYEYTYLYPGIRRVVQAAGRVIRSTTDRGTLHLVDDRFARSEVLDLLPSWWRLSERPSNPLQTDETAPCATTN